MCIFGKDSYSCMNMTEVSVQTILSKNKWNMYERRINKENESTMRVLLDSVPLKLFPIIGQYLKYFQYFNFSHILFIYRILVV